MNKFQTDEIYLLEIYDGRNITTVFTDLIVVNHIGDLYLANIIGTPKNVSRAIELLNEGKVGQVKPSKSNFTDERLNIYALNEKKNMYEVHSTKVYDLAQALLISKQVKPDTKARNEWQKEEDIRIQNGEKLRLLPIGLADLVLAWDGNVTDCIYRILDDRYNTPMLEEWKDYIVNELIERNYYIPLQVKNYGSTYKLKAGLLRVTEKQLEEIITEGIEDYSIEFAIEEHGGVQDVLSNCKTIDDYLTNFASELGEQIQKNIKIRFDPDKDLHHPAFYDVNYHANTNGITGLYPPQANTVMGIAKTLTEDSFCFLVGEMGVGKSAIGAVTPYITEAMESEKKLQKWGPRKLKKLIEQYGEVEGKRLFQEHNERKYMVEPYRAIVLSPSIMVEKWKREIKERIPNCDVYEIKSWKDVLKLKGKNKKPSRIEYYVMSSELPKFTYPLEPIKDWRVDPDQALILDETKSDTIRTVHRMQKQEDGKYHIVPFTVHDSKKRIRLIKEKILNQITGEYIEKLKQGETGFYCPSCGNPLYNRKGGMSNEHFFESFRSGKWKKDLRVENYKCKNTVSTKYLPKHQIKKWTKDPMTGRYVPEYSTQSCDYVLWQPEKLPVDSTKRKVSPAWLINKHLPRGFFKYLIADEVHEYKSGDSSVGQAFGQLINHTEKQILLTGTLMGGMSKDIFYLLARLNPKGLLKEGITYKDESLFNAKYGISEYIIRNKGKNRVIRSNAQKPGISPHLFPMHLMRNCAFLELNDMGYALPPYREIPVIVPMDERHYEEYKNLNRDMLKTICSSASLNGMASVSTYINTLYQYADAPFNIDKVTIYDQEGNSYLLSQPYNFDSNTFTPTKFDEFLRIIDEEIFKHGRKNLVYVKYTGKDAYNAMDIYYLYEKLKQLGYNVGILRNGGSYDGIPMPKNSKDREKWLNEMMEKYDWDILITNPRLVKVGLDLLAFPNIHFYQMDYSTYDYMQASRRSWRIKQTKPVKVYTYVYKDTVQENVLQLVARKIDAALAMQGKFSEEGLRAMADSSDGLNALAKQLMNEGTLNNIETVHDIFARKNQTFEEMQSVEFTEYKNYVTNPIEGGIETVRKIAEGLITNYNDRIQKDIMPQKNKVIAEYLDIYQNMIKTIEDVTEHNRKMSKRNRVAEGQQMLDLFAI